MKCISKILIVFLLIAINSEFSFAAHSSNRIDRSRLDDDIVETFPIPVLFGVDYDDVYPDFGAPRGGGTRSHEGQDFIAPQGTPIVSPTKAIVIRTGEGSSAGKYVYTANPGGETFRYMHLDEIADIKTGDRLAVGDLIGTVGDTGNAPHGVYHLHFEVRDEDNRPIDPYDRLDEDPFTLKQKAAFLDDVLDGVKDDDEYAEFLVNTFSKEIIAAEQARYSLPRAIGRALKRSDVGDQIDLLAQLEKLIDSIPSILPAPIELGDSGIEVSLLQTYLIFRSDGPAHDRLRAANATGYFGSITEAALIEYQADQDITETGVFDAKTKKALN